jgi:hypothetical protein
MPFKYDGIMEIKDSITLYPKKWPTICGLINCILFVALFVCVGMADASAFLAAGLFAVGMMFYIFRLLPGSTYLQMNQRSLTMGSFYRKTTIPWNIIDQFVLVPQIPLQFNFQKRVGFNYIKSYDRCRRARIFASALGQCEGILFENYGKKPQVLASLLNEYHERAKKESGEPTD